jgi:PAS domain S-box-containing protein
MARVNEQWQFTYANHKAEGLFRHAREELLGRVIWEVFPESVGTVFQNNYEQALADRTPTIFEAFSDLLGLWLEVAAYPSDEGLAVYLRDVTEHREVCGALVKVKSGIDCCSKVAPTPFFTPSQWKTCTEHFAATFSRRNYTRNAGRPTSGVKGNLTRGQCRFRQLGTSVRTRPAPSSRWNPWAEGVKRQHRAQPTFVGHLRSRDSGRLANPAPGHGAVRRVVG